MVSSNEVMMVFGTLKINFKSFFFLLIFNVISFIGILMEDLAQSFSYISTNLLARLTHKTLFLCLKIAKIKHMFRGILTAIAVFQSYY